MKKTIVLFVLLSATHLALAQDKAKRLDSLMTELHQAKSFNGNILVAEKGNIIYQKSFGLANEKSNKKLDLKTTFELASLSKQFTAMGIVQLEKEGKLSYDDKMSKYIPELASYEGITIKNLLTHTGGLPDYMEFMSKEWDKSKIATNIDVITTFSKLKPAALFKPNENWDYSNTGYVLLATIIERVSGKTFGDYLKAKVFKPLGMKNTFVYRRRFKPEKKNNSADGYVYSDSLKKKITPDEVADAFYVIYLDGIVGDGMVNSNLEDLLKWDRALYTDKLVSQKDKDLIFSSYKTTAGKETEYGFGWVPEQNPVYGKIVSHSGGWAGFVNYIERHLDNDKTVILLQNNDTEETKIPKKNIRKILYNQPIEKPFILDLAIQKLYAGKYVSDKGKEDEILFEEGLFMPLNADVKLKLIPISKTKFVVDGFSPEVTFEFILNPNGTVLKYRVQQPEKGVDREAKRIN